MTEMPPPNLYHQSVGWHAPTLRRTLIVVAIGAAVGLSLIPVAPWEFAVLGGWDAAVLAFLATVWPIFWRAKGGQTRLLAQREDENRGTATVMLVGASVASLLGVGFTLLLAGRTGGAERGGLVVLALVTVTLSWLMINTLFTLRYAHLNFAAPGTGIEFSGTSDKEPPEYRDFTYVAFTIGMCYQVSDTSLRDRRTRGTVLIHAALSYVFGVVIVAGVINLVAGLLH